MNEKSLGQVAYEAFGDDEWDRAHEERKERKLRFNRVALAVEAEVLRRQSVTSKKTLADWVIHFNAPVIDPDGWRGQGRHVGDLIDADEFARRWSESTCNQPAPPELEKILRRLDDTPTPKCLDIDDTEIKVGDTVEWQGYEGGFWNRQERATVDGISTDGKLVFHGRMNCWSPKSFRVVKETPAKLVPWTMEDVPGVCWIRECSQKNVWAVWAVGFGGLMFGAYVVSMTWERLLKHAEWAPTPSGPWKSCAKEASDEAKAV